MKRLKLAALAFMCVALIGLCACASSGNESKSVSSSAATSASATSASATSASSATSSASSAVASSSVSVSVADGKQLATGSVVMTTYAERAVEVGFPGEDYVDNTEPLTLLVLDEPIQVTAYMGGSDYTGAASVIRLPNDELFGQLEGRQITIAVNSWGEFPADISAMLYDLTVSFEDDGLELVEN